MIHQPFTNEAEGWDDSDERKAEATMLRILNAGLEVV